MKNKKNITKKIRILILIVLFCIFGKAEASGVTYTDIYSNTDTYLSEMETDKTRFLKMNVGIPSGPSGNDYKDYVVNRRYPGIWCLADKKINSSGNLLTVSGIIEIGNENDPTYTKIYSASGKNYEDVSGKGFKRRAMAAFTMKAGKNPSNDNITGIAQYHFYDTFETVLNKDSILKKFDYNTSASVVSNTLTRGDITYTYETYANNLAKIYSPIDKSNCKWKYTKENGAANDGTFDYNAKLTNTLSDRLDDDDGNVIRVSSSSNLVSARKITINFADNTSRTWNIKKDSDNRWYIYNSRNIKRGLINRTEGHIYLNLINDDLNKTIESVSISVEFNYIHSILYMLGGTAQQSRGVSMGEWETGEYTDTMKVTNDEDEETDISIQKFIVSVNGNQLQDYNKESSTAGTSLSRRRWYSSDYETNESAKKTVAKNLDMPTIKTYKADKPVNIEVGDEVTYRIYIYNNKDKAAKNIKVSDRIPYYTTNGSNKSAGSIIKITQKNNNTNIKSKWKTYDDNKDRKVWYYILDSLNANTYFDITIKFNINLNGTTLSNSAWVNCERK